MPSARHAGGSVPCSHSSTLWRLVDLEMWLRDGAGEDPLG